MIYKAYNAKSCELMKLLNKYIIALLIVCIEIFKIVVFKLSAYA